MKKNENNWTAKRSLNDHLEVAVDITKFSLGYYFYAKFIFNHLYFYFADSLSLSVDDAIKQIDKMITPENLSRAGHHFYGFATEITRNGQPYLSFFGLPNWSSFPPGNYIWKKESIDGVIQYLEIVVSDLETAKLSQRSKKWKN